MTGFLIRKFIKNRENTDDACVRGEYGILSGVVGIFCNAVLFVLKMVLGALSSSVSVTADAVNNLSDASSNVIGLVGFKMSTRPPDEEHPYGHGRCEYLSAFVVALLIMLVGAELLKTSVGKIINPTRVDFPLVGRFILPFSIAVKVWMAFFNKSLAEKTGSELFSATAADSRNDALTTAAVLLSSVISRLFGITIDGWVGAAVAIFILCGGLKLVRDTLSPLLGKAPDAETVARIQKKISSYPSVVGTHDLTIHDYGAGRRFAGAHVEMSAEQSPTEAHDIIDRIERDLLKEEGLHMIIHYDPVAAKNSETGILRDWITSNIRLLDGRLSIHDLKIVTEEETVSVSLDCVVPHNMEIGDREIRAFLTNIVHEKYPGCKCIVTIDKGYAAAGV